MTVNRFGVDRLDEPRRGRLETLKAKQNRTPLEDGELRGLCMSGGHQDRTWLEQHAPLSRQAASMAGGRRPSTSMTEADFKAALDKAIGPLQDQIRDAFDQLRDGGD
jgi:hypothetical protein